MELSKKIILASGSPRRQHLLREIGVDFEIKVSNVEESFPADLPVEEVPSFLAKKKVNSLMDSLPQDVIVIGADTIVALENEIINKPSDSADANNMLKHISGKLHRVITGVCIYVNGDFKIFHDITNVYFKPLTEAEIEYYIHHCSPYDKAGSYAIQEWIGMIGIEKIEGDYFNVMGLPVNKVYDLLKVFQD